MTNSSKQDFSLKIKKPKTQDQNKQKVSNQASQQLTPSVKPIITEEDRAWFSKKLDQYCAFSPLIPELLMTTSLYENLKIKLSEFLLLKKLPQLPTYPASIITNQLAAKDSQWISYFNSFIKLTPSFIFNQNVENKEYLENQCLDFWTFLYKPLQKQYGVLLQDIITYNYTPFSYSCDLFKKENIANENESDEVK